MRRPSKTFFLDALVGPDRRGHANLFIIRLLLWASIEGMTFTEFEVTFSNELKDGLAKLKYLPYDASIQAI